MFKNKLKVNKNSRKIRKFVHHKQIIHKKNLMVIFYGFYLIDSGKKATTFNQKINHILF